MMVSKENRKKFQSAIYVHILNTTCILLITSNATVPKQKIIVRPEEKINLSSNFLRQIIFYLLVKEETIEKAHTKS